MTLTAARVLMPGMRLDLHTHTERFSSDSNLAPAELIRLARQRGLDGLALTEHDTVWPWREAAQLAAAMDFLVLPAVEVTTELGHVLAYGLEALPPGVSSAAQLRQVCDEAGALMFLAHPARDGALPLRPHEMAALFDGVEGINGSDGRLQNQAAARAGAGCTLPPIAGSDSHARHEVGLAATEFDAPITSLADLLRELRAGRYRGVALE